MSRRPGGRFGTDERAVSSTVSHVLSIAIGTLLVGLLITGMSGFLADETEKATRAELESLGARLADDVAAASHLTRQGGNVSIRTGLPERVLDTRYTVAVETGAACVTGTVDSDSCLVPESADGVTVVQPLGNESAVDLQRHDADLYIHVAGGEPSGDPALPELSVAPTVGVGGVEGVSVGPAVVVNEDPVAGFVFGPGNPTAGDEISFVNDTADLDGIITSYEWTFELPNGGNRTVTGPTATQTYDTPGVYRVTLTVTDDEGETDEISRRVPVSGLVFTGDDGTFTADPDPREGGVWFSMTNTWEDPVEITTLGFDPEAPPADVDSLDESSALVPEILFDAGETIPTSVTTGDLSALDTGDGYVDFDGGITVPEDGIIVDVDSDGADGHGANPTVGPGENVTVYLSELRDGGSDVADADDFPSEVAVRYRVNGSIYVSKTRLFSLDQGDTVTWETASDWDDALAETNVTHPDSVVTLDAAAGGSGVPQNGLQVWLPLNETASDECDEEPGDACDYAGGANYQFTLEGSPTRGVSGVDGGLAYEFDGSSWLYDRNAEDNYLENTDELTVSMWVKADETGTNAGLLDTVADGDDGDDDELGLRYDSAGYAGGGSNTFKASHRVDGSDSYAYEYESDVQSTDWQHVVLRWDAGGEVELFVDGERLDYTYSSGDTPAGSRFEDDDGGDEDEVFLGIGRSQKDDLDALWEGRIDEVRIYDRALAADEVQSLTTHGGLRRGHLNTSWKTTASDLDLADLRLGYDAQRAGGTVQVTVVSRYDDGTTVESEPVVLSGDNGVREVAGLTGDADEFRLHVEFSGVSNTPSADSFTLGD